MASHSEAVALVRASSLLEFLVNRLGQLVSNGKDVGVNKLFDWDISIGAFGLVLLRQDGF